MNLIDVAGLTDSDALPAKTYIKALRLQGYLVPEEERDRVLESLRVGVSEADSGDKSVSGPANVASSPKRIVTVVTGPGGMDYWSAAPPSVRVRVVPSEQEVGQSERSPTLLEWFLRRRGLTLPEARVLVAKPPTARHGKFREFVAASQDVSNWEMWDWGELTDLDNPPFEYVGGEPPAQGSEYSVTIVDTFKKYAQLGEELNRARDTGAAIGLDVETDEDENYESGLVGVGLAFGASRPHTGGAGGTGAGANAERGRTYYLPVRQPAADAARSAITEDVALSLLRFHFLEKSAPWWIAHGGKFDAQAMAKAMLPANPVAALRHLFKTLKGDGLIAAYCAAFVDQRTGRPEPKGLKPLSKRYYNAETLTFLEMLGLSGATRSSEAPVKDIGPYCCADAYWGVCVLDGVLLDLSHTPKLLSLYEKLELRTVAVLAEMELLGMPVDRAKLSERRAKTQDQVEVLRRYLERGAIEAGYQPPLDGTVIKGYVEKTVACLFHKRQKALYLACSECDDHGRVTRVLPFNPNSAAQLSGVLQGTFGLPMLKVTDGGDPSNDEITCLKLREYTPDTGIKDWISFYLGWSKLSKVAGYQVNWQEHARVDVFEPKHRAGSQVYLHSRYSQDIAVTGRLTSSQSNLQNVTFEQRDLFPIDWDADYSQLELRIFAFASKDPAMIQTFQEGGDIHATTTWRVFGVRPEDQTPVLRVRGKTLNFGMSYGAQGETVQEQILKAALLRPDLHIPIPSLAECKEMVKNYWKAYPVAREYVEFIKDMVRERYWSETFYGRREYFPFIRSNVPELRARAERQAVNLIIQGTAGDLIKMAALLLYEDAPKFQADVRSQVHDELMGCIWTPDSDMKQDWLRLVERTMLLDQPLMPVPLKVDPKLVGTWKEAK